ncbi:MAG: enoyl-CoA hydratase/carnithine racemase [Myxococcota bacterium]
MFTLGPSQAPLNRSYDLVNEAEPFPQYPTLATDLVANVLTVTLNRPERLNAFNTQMMHDLLALYEAVDQDDRVRAVILTGAGRGFCAGADLAGGGGTFDSGAGEEDPQQAKRAPRDGGGRVTLRMYDCKKPIIAAINGAAVGVGLTMTLPMDIRLASTKAKFGFVFARRGLVPEAASSWFLPRIAGIAKAMEWVATGRIFGPDEALAAGLVSEVLEEDALLDRAQEIAREIVENTSPVSIALSRQMLWQMLGARHPMEAHRVDSIAIHQLGSGPDAREGVTSFLEKRPPVFSLKVSEDLPDIFSGREAETYEGSEE